MGTVHLITVAMAAARTLAMGANRVIDRELDARNPRTAGRPLVTGTITPTTAWAGSAVAVAVLAVAAYALGPLPFRLLPGAILFLIGYPLTKRFTVFSHLILGATDGLAPLGAWAAIRGSLATPATSRPGFCGSLSRLDRRVRYDLRLPGREFDRPNACTLCRHDTVSRPPFAYRRSLMGSPQFCSWPWA
jgi:hypothetical protein